MCDSPIFSCCDPNHTVSHHCVRQALRVDGLMAETMTKALFNSNHFCLSILLVV